MPSEEAWKILIVDDDADICSDVQKALERVQFGDPPSQVEVSIELKVANTTNRLKKERFDLVIQDIFTGPPEKGIDHGFQAFDEIKQLRFVPIIFYTARPEHAQTLDSVYVKIVDKADGTDALKQAMKDVFATKLPALIRHLEDVQRTYLWTDLPKLIQESPLPLDVGEPACLIARRLAQIMSGDLLRAFLNIEKGKVHPAEIYIIPPCTPQLLSGDLHKQRLGGKEIYWILLTPSCDLVPGRRRRGTQYLLFAQCLLLSDQPEYKAWIESIKTGGEEEERAKQKLADLIRNNRGGKYQPERYYFLPSVMHVPDLVVDYQELEVLEKSEFQAQNWERIASLDSPYAAELLTRFARYFGRIGTPDLDIELILARIESSLTNIKQKST